METTPDKLNQALTTGDSLRLAFMEQLPGRIQRIDRELSAALETADWRAALKAVCLMAHHLANACDRYGLIPPGEAAASLARHLDQVIEAPLELTAHQKTQIRSYLAVLEQVSEQRVAAATEQIMRHAMAEDVPLQENLIYLVEGAGLLAAELVAQIQCFGYTTQPFTSPTQMLATARHQPPAAIIIDLDGDPDLAMLAHAPTALPPLIFLSTSGDMATRLKAVRAAGDAFFVKPVEAGRLVDKLDSLIRTQEVDPYRVLVVDDSPLQARYFADILEQGGLRTYTATDAMEILTPLHEFHPDLILMDMYMPACNGREMAKVIRQQEMLDSVPIVFLSSESNVDKQLAAMRNLGDGFIHKEILPEHLISTVMTRAERSRILRSFMVRDSLTGLLNHTTTKRRLETELQRAKRYNHHLSLAMIDIDHFKKINDTYGHPTGDSVIKSLTRLLQQRLRKTDIIGRYGGEEFAVIMPETDARTAVKILDRIRVSFSQVSHIAEHIEFQVQFSCGVAEFPLCETAAELNNSADSALYEAKRTRNRVVLFS